MSYEKYQKYKKKYLQIGGCVKDRYNEILLGYETISNYLMTEKKPKLFSFETHEQNKLYMYVTTLLLNNKISDKESIVQYFTTCEEFNKRSECSVSLYYNNDNWSVSREIKRGCIKVDLNNMWIVFLLQYYIDNDITNILDPGELYGILDKIGLIKKTRDWKYISNI